VAACPRGSQKLSFFMIRWKGDLEGHSKSKFFRSARPQAGNWSAGVGLDYLIVWPPCAVAY
jgi:hypothetical protein